MFAVVESLSQPSVVGRNILICDKIFNAEKPSKLIAIVKFRRGNLENSDFQIHADGDTALIFNFLIKKSKMYGIQCNGEFDRFFEDFQENSVISVKQGTIILGPGSIPPQTKTAISNVHWLNCHKSVATFSHLDNSSRFAVVATITNIVKAHFYYCCSGCCYKSLREEQGTRHLDCPKCEQRTQQPITYVIFEVIIANNGAKELVAIFTDDVLRLSGEPDVDSLENRARNDYQQMRERFEGKNYIICVRPNIYLEAEWNVTAIQKID